MKNKYVMTRIIWDTKRSFLTSPWCSHILGPEVNILLRVHTSDGPKLGKLLYKCSTTICQGRSYSADVEHTISFPLGHSRTYIYFSATVVKQWLCVKRCLISALVTFRSIGSLNERPIPLDLQVASPADYNRWQKFEIIVRNVLQHPHISCTHHNFA